MSSHEDRALCELLDRMVPGLKRAIMRDSERRPDSMNLEIVLLSSVMQNQNGPVRLGHTTSGEYINEAAEAPGPAVVV